MLNLEKCGRPLVRIVGNKQLNNKIVSVCTDDDNQITKRFNNLNLPSEAKAKFQHIPNTEASREVLYICGPSGSGKSTYTRKYCQELQKQNKSIDIYLISPFTEDESLDEIKPKRIKLDKSLVEDPIDCKELGECAIIFDDIDSIKEKDIKKAVQALLSQCLEIGRHYKITVIMTNHILCAGNDTKRILNECHTITCFPHSGSKRTIKYLLEDYCGLNKADVKLIKKQKTRWCTVYKNYPIVICTEESIWSPQDSD